MAWLSRHSSEICCGRLHGGKLEVRHPGCWPTSGCQLAFPIVPRTMFSTLKYETKTGWSGCKPRQEDHTNHMGWISSSSRCDSTREWAGCRPGKRRFDAGKQIAGAPAAAWPNGRIRGCLAANPTGFPCSRNFAEHRPYKPGLLLGEFCAAVVVRPVRPPDPQKPYMRRVKKKKRKEWKHKRAHNHICFFRASRFFLAFFSSNYKPSLRVCLGKAWKGKKGEGHPPSLFFSFLVKMSDNSKQFYSRNAWWGEKKGKRALLKVLFFLLYLSLLTLNKVVKS